MWCVVKRKIGVISFVGIVSSILTFLYIPILIMIFFSFNSKDSLRIFSGFSLKHYSFLFRNKLFWEALLTSLFIGFLASSISVFFAFFASVFFHLREKKVADNFFLINNVLITGPDIFLAVSLMLMFLSLKFHFGLLTLLLAHVSLCLPQSIVIIYPRVRKINPILVEAASDLGANFPKILRTIIIPQIKNAVFFAWMFSFITSFDDFTISYFTSGANMNVSTFFYAVKRMKPYINAFGTLLILFLLSTFFIWRLYRRVKKVIERRQELFKKKIYLFKWWVVKKKKLKKYSLFFKSFFSLIVIFSSFAGLTILYSNLQYDLLVMNWGEYMSSKVIKQFQQEYSKKVRYITYASNEEFYNKINTVRYDVAFPSEYMVSRLADEEKIEDVEAIYKELEHVNLSRKKLDSNLNTLISREQNKKIKTYSIPYFWGDIMLITNSWKVKLKREDDSWRDIIENNIDKKILLTDDVRNFFMLYFSSKENNQSVNPQKKSDIAASKKWLSKIWHTKNIKFLGDNIIDEIARGNFDLAIGYNGDILKAIKLADEKVRKNFNYQRCKKTNIWIDAMVINKRSSNKELARNFIKFVVKKHSWSVNKFLYSSPFESEFPSELTEEEKMVYKVGGKNYIYDDSFNYLYGYKFADEFQRIFDEIRLV